ncbi:unnamed protein product, partial [Rotaria sp. Silwood2]
NTIESSVELEERFQNFENDTNKIVSMVIIDGRIGHQHVHIPFVRQLVDKSEYLCNVVKRNRQKYFLILVHSPAQELYHQSSFQSIFLHNWEFYFFDTCASGSAFHLQKMLQILSSTHDQKLESFDNILCDLNILFDDCLWDFCSRIQNMLPELPHDAFKNELAYTFYQHQTNTIRRVKCLKQILKQCTQLQKHIVNIYHESLSIQKNSSEKIYKMIYDISKDILCGKRFDGLVNSIQSQTRISFANFVSNIFKFIINDYGLDTLLKLSTTNTGYDSLLNLIDYSSFIVNNNDKNILSSSTTNEVIQLTCHYSYIPETPLYYLIHQRIKSCADKIKQKILLGKNEYKGL